MCSYAGFAQISVTATVGTATATYTTLKGAFDAINAGTHKGVINISVTGNTTETGRDSLAASGGATTSYTSVTIKPAASTQPVINGALAGTMFYLVGTNNLTIDGSNTNGGTTKDLTIINTDTTGRTFYFSNGASNNTVKNCVIKGSIRTSGVISFVGSTAATGNNNNTFQNNDITAANTTSALFMPLASFLSIGSANKHNTGNIIRNNRISNFQIGYYDGSDNGSSGSVNTVIDGNEFFSTMSSTGSVSGVFLYDTSIANMTISNNLMHDFQSSVNLLGIQIYDSRTVNIYNNMIALNSLTAQTIYGILQEAGSPNNAITVYYNSVHITGSTSGTNFSIAYAKDFSSTGDIVKNNIFVNTRTSTGTAKQYAIGNVPGGTLTPFTSNYNDLVVSGSAGAVGVTDPTGTQPFGTSFVSYTTLANWQAASSQDANSISILPAFNGTSDLHLLNVAVNAALDNKGTPISGITTDYDNQARSATTPDLGADEFTVTATAVANIDADVTSSLLMPNIIRNQAMMRVSTKKAMIIQWTVTDANGRKVMSFEQKANAGQNDMNLQLGKLSAGTYYINGSTSKGNTTVVRFVKF